MASSAPSGAPGGLTSGSPLVVPEAQPLLGGQSLSEAEKVQLNNPEAVSAREESCTKYENLGATQADAVDAEAFPAEIDHSLGGPPSLQAGQALTGFLNGNAAQVELGEGQHGVIESTLPMATASSPGHWSAVNLGLGESGGAFSPTNPLVNVTIPKRLASGAQLPEQGVSLTPVSGSASPLTGSEGVIDGSVVLYANTQTDTDTVIKPTPPGFDVAASLRSIESPQQLNYRVGLPQGASLVQEAASGVVRVVKEGATIATVSPPVAQDAAGTQVPVTMTVSGDDLVLTIDHRSGSYLYPIAVDPEVNTATENFSTGNWHPSETNGFTYERQSAKLVMNHTGSFPVGEWSYWGMQTNGDSSIYEVNIHDDIWPLRPWPGETREITYPYQVAWLELLKESERREKVIAEANPLGAPPLFEATLCWNSECSPEGVAEHNAIRFELSTTESSKFYEENGYWSDIPFGGSLENVTTYIAQPKSTHSTVGFNTSATEVDRTNNVLHSGGGGLGPKGGAFEFTANDLGLGVAGTKIEYDGSRGWEVLQSRNYLAESSCIGVQCAATQSEAVTYSTLSSLPNGSDLIRVAASDAEPNTSSSEHGEGETHVIVDTVPPHNLKLSGLPSKGEAVEMTEAESHVKAEATDGEGSAASSGIKSIELYIDERQTGKASGYCSPGPCTATGEWTLNGAEFGVGQHTLTIKATDGAGNVETRKYTLYVNAATPVAMGPGSVNPESGDLALEAADVNISGGSGALAVTRHYDSRNVKEGEEGPLGPQWSISLGSLASLEVLPDGSVMVVGPDGLSHFAVKTGGGFEAPVGDSNLTLEPVKNSKGEITEYLLKDPLKGTTTGFTLPEGARSWMPTISTGPVATDTVTDTYQTAEPEAGKKIVEPKLELAPHASASCPAGEPTKWEKGCRGLEFVYAEKTKEHIGENESEWGEYKGRLAEVKFIAYNPATGTIVTPGVARYEYDKQGRMRAEWNPEISPGLKTFYGYDPEGHVTALTAPGRETWTFTYGTIPGDSSTGRLIKTRQAPQTAALWKGKTTAYTEAPKLSGTASTEVKMGVSTGTWNYEPVSYGYQWEDCNSEGNACTPIQGATNPNYTPVVSDVGHTLVAQVSATNGGGTTMATARSAVVIGATTPTYVSTFGSSGTEEGKLEGPLAIARSAASGNLWLAEGCLCGNLIRWRLQKFKENGEYISGFGVKGSSEYPGGIALDEHGDIWVTDGYYDKIREYKENGETVSEFGSEGTGKSQFKYPDGVALDSHGDIWVADRNNNRVQEFNEKHEWVRETTGLVKEPNAIAAGPGGAIWVVDKGDSRVVKLGEQGEYLGQAGSAGSGNGQLNDPTGVAVDSKGNMWVADTGNHRIQEFNAQGEYLTQFGSQGEGAGQFEKYLSITLDTSGDAWISEGVECEHCRRVEKWTAPATTEGQSYSPSPGSTIEYNVPVEGAGAPQQMGINEETHKAEPGKWAQKDDPVYATAIFAPENPQTWPATNYQQATTYYIDGQARTVNVASPTGGISTTEYNENNEVERSLTPDNRATALKEREESKSAEVAELLSTKSTYNAEGQLEETLGPQHSVKRSTGLEAVARNRVKYYYDEGAKEVEEKTHEKYDLVTKTTDAAETASKEVFDERTSTTSYGGQNNLGWTLRKPTSEVTEPGGLRLTHTTIYEEGTGNVVETRTPTDSSGESSPPVYYDRFGASGSGAGQFTSPLSMATDSSGNLWVVDHSNNRIDQFGPTGTFLKTIGFGVSNGEEKLQSCTSSCRAGISGAGNGQFKGPRGIAVNQSNGNIYVDDSGNGRIEEFSSSGTFVRAFGSPGSGHGNLSEANGLTIDSTGNVWVADTGNNRVEEFSAEGVYESTFGSEGSGNGQLKTPNDVVFDDGNLFVDDYSNSRIEEFSTKGEYLSQFGTEGSGNGQFSHPSRIAVDPLSGNLYISDHGNTRVQEFNPDGAFLAKFGIEGETEGRFKNLKAVAVSPSGEVYTAEENLEHIQGWLPPSTGYTGAQNTQMIYYIAKANAKVAACGLHPEWANLPCQSQPLTQPEDGTSNLPVTTILYNMWDQAETVTEKFGSVTRTKKTTFDGAERPLTSEETSSIDTALPTVIDKYNTTNGALETQSTKIGETTETITSLYNTLGELASYTDADANTATYTYDEYNRLKTVSDSSDEGKSKQTYTYSETTNELTNLEDSVAKIFAATYDVEGKITSEAYPNGMTAYYTYNSAGETTGLEYKKLTHCTEKCTWFSDTMVPSIHGEMLTQKSTLSEESYTYDAAGRLTHVDETPAGVETECRNDEYVYDEESNRLRLTHYKNNESAGCTTSEGSTTEYHTYDTANHLTDTGVTYETFGSTVSLPAKDAGGSELTSSYYVDNQVYKQTVNDKTTEYKLDPEGRAREAVSGGSATISYYDAPGSAVAWTAETGGHSTRNIPGIGGELAAIQANGGTPELKLHDLQGNIVANAAMSETETKLLSTYNSTEFGVPTTGSPPKYSWLGAVGVASESPSGVVTQDGVTYVPQTGRPLQTQGTAPPVPVNAATPFVSTIEPWVAETAGAAAAHQTALAEQAREALDSPSGGCDEYMQGCGPDPEKGVNSAYCSVWVSWDHYLNNRLGITGHAFCVRPEIFEMQIALLIELPNGHFTTYESKRIFKTLFHNAEEKSWDEFSHTWVCEEGHTYQAWIFGRYWYGQGPTVWSATAEDGHTEGCSSLAPEGDPTPGPSGDGTV
jgi:YD repeat-containing protein